MTEACTLQVHHDGYFKTTQNLIYCEGFVSKIELDPDYFSVGDIRSEVESYGYANELIKTIYFLRPNCSLGEGLVDLKNDADVHVLIALCYEDREIHIYVEHVKGGESHEIGGSDDSTSLSESDDDANEVDEEIVEIKKRKREVDKNLNKKRVELRANGVDVGVKDVDNGEEGVNNGEEGVDNGEEGVDNGYHNSSHADSPTSEDEEDSEQRKNKRKQPFIYPRFNPTVDGENFDFYVGMAFTDKAQFKEAVDDYRVRRGYNVRIKVSDKERLQVRCAANSCKWSLWPSKPKNEASFTIKTLPVNHTCIPYGYGHGERHISTKWVVKKYKEIFRMFPNMKSRELINLIEKNINFKPSMGLCIKVRKEILKSVIGDYREDFALLRNYAYEVCSKNSGSTVKIHTESNAQIQYEFQVIYICLGSLKKGFLEGCRRVLSIDACFMKGPEKGQIYTAIGRDANDQMYPVAWGIRARENYETWKWFLDLLKDDLCIGDGQSWTFISDQQKGLVDSIEQLFPKAEYRLCARHVYANLRKKWRGLKFREIFWKIAKSSNEVQYLQYMTQMKELDVGAWEILEKKDPKHFCRLFFHCDVESDSVDNNMAEIFNFFIIDARFKPIVGCLDEIFSLVMSRVANKKRFVNGLQQDICPLIVKKMMKHMEESKFWMSTSAENGFYSVKHGDRGFVVNLNSKICTCRAWELNGIPCGHVLAVLRSEKLDPLKFMHSCCQTERLKRIYAHTITPINGREMWVKAPYGEVVAPPFFKVRKMGSIQVKRRREEGEQRRTQFGRVRKNGVTMHCSNCGEEGHNKKTCKNPPKEKVQRSTQGRATTSSSTGPPLMSATSNTATASNVEPTAASTTVSNVSFG